MPSIPTQTIGAERRARLAVARLYLVCPPLAERSSSALESASAPRELSQLLAGAIAGGVDVVQLREKHLPGDELTALARTAQQQCSRLGALLIVNDHPEIALAAGADGVHVGQDDMPAAAVRGLVGPELLIGLSTHSPAQIDQVDAALVDYIGVGPIHATPTKPGRPAVGLALVRYAAEHATVPFVAIGGITPANAGAAREAGAERIAVVRALTEAADPAQAARRLWRALGAPAPGVGGEVRVGAAE